MLTPNSDISAMDAGPHEHAVGDRPDERADDGHDGQRQRALGLLHAGHAAGRGHNAAADNDADPEQDRGVPAHDAGQKAVGQGGHQRRGRADERLGGREGQGSALFPTGGAQEVPQGRARSERRAQVAQGQRNSVPGQLRGHHVGGTARITEDGGHGHGDDTEALEHPFGGAAPIQHEERDGNHDVDAEEHGLQENARSRVRQHGHDAIDVGQMGRRGDAAHDDEDDARDDRRHGTVFLASALKGVEAGAGDKPRPRPRQGGEQNEGRIEFPWVLLTRPPGRQPYADDRPARCDPAIGRSCSS